MNTRCPLCLSSGITDLGRICHREPALVAGIPIDLSAMTFALKRCDTCQLSFKDPFIPKHLLDRCYAASDSSNWGLMPDPLFRRFDQMRELVARFAAGKSILDIGCFNGAMLDYFGTEWERFGLEPSIRAAGVAGERGIRILGSTVADLENSRRFDVVTAIDVIEHLTDPVDFFSSIRAHLDSKGIIVLFTGDAGSWPWKLQKSRYWYCSLPEHVIFWSREAIQKICDSNDLRILYYERIRHDRASVRAIARELVKNVVFWAGGKSGGFGLPVLKRKLDRSAPTWLSAPDHMLCVLQVK